MKISKITFHIDDMTKVIETLVDNNVYDFNVSICGVFVTIRINNEISPDNYQHIKDALRFDAMSRIIDHVYIYPEDGQRVEIG